MHRNPPFRKEFFRNRQGKQTGLAEFCRPVCFTMPIDGKILSKRVEPVYNKLTLEYTSHIGYNRTESLLWPFFMPSTTERKECCYG